MKGLTQKSNGSWEIRKQVPVDVRSVVGRTAFKKSLGFLSKDKAQLSAAPYLSDWNSQIDAARAGRPIASGGKVALESISARRDRHESGYRGRAYDPASEPNPLDVLQQERDMYEEAVQVFLARKRGEEAYLSFVEADDEAHDVALQGLLAEGSSNGYLVFLEDYVDEFMDKNYKHVKARTYTQNRTALQSEFVKHFPVVSERSLSKGAVQDWLEGYVDRDEIPASRTVSRYLTVAKGFCEWMESKGYLADAGFISGVRLPRAISEQDNLSRKPFNDDQLASVLSALEDRKDETLLAVTKIAMFTGARIEEIFQITCSDVKSHEGRWVIELEGSKSESGKNRVVPVHKELEVLLEGLVDAAGVDGYLITEGSSTKYGERSSSASKRFRTVTRGLGYGGEYVFHSIRKSFVTKAEQASVPEGVVADIVGHAKRTMSYGVYSGGTSLEQRFQAIDSISYDSGDG